MPLSILPTAESNFEDLRRVQDIVAREKCYLAFLQAPPPEQAFDFFRNIVTNGLCQFLALQDGVVVGWCDILPTLGEARAHVGILGIGLIPQARHLGIGAKLMEAALAQAWKQGFTRIELSVRTDNTNAKTLYERFDFTLEGVNRNAFYVDGKFFDTYSMALLRPTSAQSLID